LFILRTTLVQEAGWTFKDLRIQRRDALFSVSMMFIVSASVMAAAAGTLHLHGTRLEESSQMVTLLEPLIGLFAISIFTLGMIAAGISSQFPNVTLTPYLLDDYNRVKPNMKLTRYRILVLALSLLGLLVPLLNAPPVAVMVTSQAFGALILPVTVACLIFLGNKKSLMKEHAFTWGTNTGLSLILLFSFIMSYMSYSGLFNTIARLLG
jgi:manganese transport protein